MFAVAEERYPGRPTKIVHIRDKGPQFGIDRVGPTPERFGARHGSESAQWAALIEAQNIEAN